MSPRVNSYDAIVNAAEAVVMEAGASHMTLDAVAAKAGVSKGGLLHHFPTKEALLEAMIKRNVTVRKELLEMVWQELPEGPARLLKANIVSNLLRAGRVDRLGTSLLAALAHNPKLAEPVRETIKEYYAKYASGGIKFERAVVLALAVDGLILQEVLSLSPFTEEQRHNVIEELLRMTDEAALK